MIPRPLLSLVLASTIAAAGAQPATEAIDPNVVRARDWLQRLDRGEYDQAIAEADDKLKSRGAERLAAEVQKARKGETTIACRTAVYVELFDDGAIATFVSRLGNGQRVAERVTLRYGDNDALRVSGYRVEAAPKDKPAACAGG